MVTKLSALRRRPSPAMILAFTSLCIALAGNASALPGKDVVTKNDIRASAVGTSEIATSAVGKSEAQRDSVGQSELIEGDLTGLQVKDRSLSAEDFNGSVTGDKGDAGPQGPTGPTGAIGVQGPPGPSTGPAGGDLAGSYPNPLIGPDAVGMSEIAPSAVGALEIAPDSVAQDEVENGGLDAADNKAAGVDNLDFGSIAANTCASLTIDAGVSVEGDTVVTTPEESFSLQLSISTSDAVAANSFRVNVCNPTGAAVDPVGSEFSWVVFDN